jgi:hypothetical protein
VTPLAGADELDDSFRDPASHDRGIDHPPHVTVTICGLSWLRDNGRP